VRVCRSARQLGGYSLALVVCAWCVTSLHQWCVCCAARLCTSGVCVVLQGCAPVVCVLCCKVVHQWRVLECSGDACWMHLCDHVKMRCDACFNLIIRMDAVWSYVWMLCDAC
jgi:hypothetical protein